MYFKKCTWKWAQWDIIALYTFSQGLTLLTNENQTDSWINITTSESHSQTWSSDKPSFTLLRLSVIPLWLSDISGDVTLVERITPQL